MPRRESGSSEHDDSLTEPSSDLCDPPLMRSRGFADASEAEAYKLTRFCYAGEPTIALLSCLAALVLVINVLVQHDRALTAGVAIALLGSVAAVRHALSHLEEQDRARLLFGRACVVHVALFFAGHLLNPGVAIE